MVARYRDQQLSHRLHGECRRETRPVHQITTRNSLKRRLDELESAVGADAPTEIVIRDYRAEDFEDPLDPDHDAVEPWATTRVTLDEHGEYRSERQREDRDS